MIRHLRILAIAAMVGVLALGVVTPARANLQIWISTTNDPPVLADQVATAPSGGTASFTDHTFAGGTFDINSLSASSNSPGTATETQLLGANLSLKNLSGSTATLFITIGDTGFTQPVNPPNVDFLSHIGGTVVAGNAANLLNFGSYINTTNGQNATSGPSTFPQSPSITATGSFNNDSSGTIVSGLTAPYSITERFAITLGAGAQINFSSSTTLSAVPEPSSLALAALGALGMIGYGLRRRKALGA
jgi:hypothetical protein